MKNDQVSLTALISAFGRAYHSINNEPRIFDDFLAKSMMTEETFDFIGHSLANTLAFFEPGNIGLELCEADALAYVMKKQTSPITLSRAKYTEDRLEEAISNGVEQYIILGAGLDTFAFRRPELLEKLQVFELDHPATQDYKQNRLKELGWVISDRLHMIPVNFSKDNLSNVLDNSGFDSSKISFFSWLGVTYYLEFEDILSTLHTIADISATGSIIIFDYLDLDAFNPDNVSERVKLMQEIVKRAGEPMKTGFDPDKLQEQLSIIGLQLMEDKSPEDIQEAYFMERTDGYSAFEHVHFAKIKVL